MVTSIYSTTGRAGDTFGNWVAKGLAFGASGGGRELEVWLQMTECVEKSHEPKDNVLHITGNWRGNGHGGLHFLHSGSGYGEPVWDLGKARETKTGGVNFLSHHHSDNGGLALDGVDTENTKSAPASVGTNGVGVELTVSGSQGERGSVLLCGSGTCYFIIYSCIEVMS